MCIKAGDRIPLIRCPTFVPPVQPTCPRVQRVCLQHVRPHLRRDAPVVHVGVVRPAVHGQVAHAQLGARAGHVGYGAGGGDGLGGNGGLGLWG